MYLCIIVSSDSEFNVHCSLEALKTFGRPLFGKLSTRIFELITVSPRGSDTVTVSVTEIAGLG